MGKPFSQELEILQNTYEWAINVPLDKEKKLFDQLNGKSTYIVGSGGSQSACVLFGLLQQNKGTIANAITPLELQYCKNAISSNSSVVFISASGKNTDILFAYDVALAQEPDGILNICLKKDSALAKRSAKHSISHTIELNNPAGKDGFLATNSLLAYFTIISRLFNSNLKIEKIAPSKSYFNDITKFTSTLHQDFTLIVLYAGWSKPVAIDIESKFSEAGLGNVLLTDYRNFGHGRHNWLDKKKEQTAIVALITPTEVELAKKTIDLLPKSIKVLELATTQHEENASIDLLVKSFYFVNEVGKLKQIDPGRPGVPSYGSKLYNLKYSRLLKGTYSPNDKSILAIKRKTGLNLNPKSDYFKKWHNEYKSFIKKLGSTKFSGVLLDYDGTLCANHERFDGPGKEIENYLNLFLKHKIQLGIITGRGQSVRKDLQKIIDKSHWSSVLVGYYNGSQIGTLNDNSLPVTSANPSPELKSICDYINGEAAIGPFIKEPTLRPGQLTIEIADKEKSKAIKETIIDTLKNKYPFKIQVLESSHSVDIISIETSKLAMIQACHSYLKDPERKLKLLCIGDRGKFPGNDYQLLGTDFSLSVDKTSYDPKTCWNLSSLGNNCIEATLQYFHSFKLSKNHFRIKI